MKKLPQDNPTQFNYSVLEAKENPEESTIKKVGYFKNEARFTIKQIKEDIERLRKKKIELSAEKDLKDAMLKNVINHYPEVKDMDKKLRIAVFLYEEATNKTEIISKVLDDINRGLDDYALELDEIAKQTKIQINA